MHNLSHYLFDFIKEHRSVNHEYFLINHISFPPSVVHGGGVYSLFFKSFPKVAIDIVEKN
jgi:hypothetical protein